MPFPEHLSFEEAATLPCAALTAWTLISSGDLKAGDTVLVQGTGGVSLFAAVCENVRARVVATSSSDAKLARARELGADVLINYKTTAEWGDAAQAHRRVGVDHVVEVGGAGTYAQSMRRPHRQAHFRYRRSGWRRRPDQPVAAPHAASSPRASSSAAAT